MSARGEFYDYRDKDGMGRVYAVHRRSIHSAMHVCKEWDSLLLNEEVKVVCDNQKATDWINTFFSSTNFMNAAQATVVRAFGLGRAGALLVTDYIPPVDVTVRLFMDMGYNPGFTGMAQMRVKVRRWLSWPGGGNLVLPARPRDRVP